MLCTRVDEYSAAAVLFLVAILENSKMWYGQLDAPEFYSKFREVGIRPGAFLAFFQASK